LVDGLRYTGAEALLGLAFGCTAGVALAVVGRLVPAAAPGIFALASIVNGIPIIAVAGVAVLTLPRDATPIVVAALASAFVVFVGTAAGFASVREDARDLFAVLGASRWATFARLDVPWAAAHVLDAARSAAPASVVGAIIGEWFAAEHGLGPMLIAAMQNYAMTQLWLVALTGTALSLALYGSLGLVRAAAERALR